MDEDGGDVGKRPLRLNRSCAVAATFDGITPIHRIGEWITTNVSTDNGSSANCVLLIPISSRSLNHTLNLDLNRDQSSRSYPLKVIPKKRYHHPTEAIIINCLLRFPASPTVAKDG